MQIRSASNTNEVNWDDPLNKGLVAWYPFKERGGNVLHDIANRHDGDLYKVEQNDWVPCTETGAMALDLDGANNGTDEYVVAPSIERINGATQLTVSAWIRPRQVNASNMGIVSKYVSEGSNSRSWGLYFSTSQELAVALSSDGTFQSGNTLATSSAADSQWRHVAFTYDAATATRLFIGGVLKATNTTRPSSLYASSKPVIVGMISYDAYDVNADRSTFNGGISDVRIYDRALSESEVHDLYQASRTGYKDQFKRRYFPVSLQTEEPPTETATSGLIRLKSPKPTNEVNWDDPLNKGLVAWYPFKQKGGNVLRDVAGNFDGNLQSSMTSDDWVTSPETKSLALDLDGADDHVNCGTGTFGILPGSYEMTLSAWCKVRTFEDYPAILAKNSGTAPFGGWQLNVDSTGRFSLAFNKSGSWTVVTTSSVFSTNEWYLVTGTRWNGGHSIFVNGTLEGQGSGSGTIEYRNAADPVLIGRNEARSETLDGQVSDVRIYNRALSESEVHDLYQASRTGYQDQFKRRYFPVGVTPTPTESHPSNGLIRLRSPKPTNEVNWDDPLNKGLVAWFPMRQDNGFDNIRDVSRSRLVAVSTGDLGTVAGPNGNLAYSLDAPSGDNWIAVNGTADNPAFNPGTGSLSFGAWIRPETDGWFFHKGDAGANADWWGLRVAATTGVLQSRFDDGTSIIASDGSTTVDDGEWHFAFCTWDAIANVLRVYVDGRLDGTGTSPNIGSVRSDLYGFGGTLRLGAITNTSISSSYKGAISDVRIYNRALSESEVHDLYVASRTGYKDQYKRRYFPVSLQPLTLLEKIRSVAKPTTTRAISVKKNSVPGYKAGYAKSASESANPKLMEGLRLAWVPSAFYSGISVIRDISPGGSVNGSLINYTSDNVEIIDGKVVYRNQTDRAIRSAKLPFELTSTSDISVIWNGRPFSNYNYLGVLSEGTGDGDVKLGVNSSSQLYNFRFITPGTSSTLAKNTAWLNAREMHQFVQVYDNSAGKWRFYIDGEFESDLSAASNSWDADDTFRLGEGFRNVSGNWRIGDFLVYDRALSDSEVKQLDRDPLAPFRKKTTVGYQPSKELRGLFRT